MLRKCTILFFPFLVLIGIIIGFLISIDYIVKKRTTLYTFEINNVPLFLTEEIAIGFARKALTLEGFDGGEWEVQEDGRTVDPDGRKDQYVSRNSLNPNRVQMIFLRKPNRHVRCVDVELEGKKIVCFITIPK